MSSKVLVLATTFPRWKNDTEPAFVYYLSEFLAQRSFSMTVLVPHAGGAAFRERLGSLEVRRFPYFRPYQRQKLCYNGGALPNLRRYWLARFQLPLFLLAQRRAITHTIKSEPWDLVHAHWIVPQGYLATAPCRRRNIPLLLTAHAGDVFAMQHPLVRLFATHALRQAVSCTVNSNATVEAVLRLHGNSTVNLVPMGVDLGLFHPGLPDEGITRRFDLRGKTILGVGRFAPKKGFQHLVNAVHILAGQWKEIRLLLIGFGPEEDALKAQVKDLKLEDTIKFVGKISHAELPKYYRTCQAFAAPSVVLPSGDTEGQGVVLLESMASSVPTVASRVGGIVDIVEHEMNGLLVPPEDPKALAEALRRVLMDETLASELTKNGIDTIQRRFSWESTADRFAELYQRIIG